ncbi:MAG TPA: ABC transporter permease [Acidimicrobiales bacterium]
MNPAIVAATAQRVLQQLRRDRRTVALLLAVPCAELVLVRFMINADGPVFDRFGLPLLGIFPLISMFLVTSIAMLRERTSGTLERLLTLPAAKLDILAGYGLAFGAAAALQAGVLVAVAVAGLGLGVTGPLWAVVAMAVANAVLGTALGLLTSAFAATEFQAVQFMPAFILPQLLLCGLAVPRDAMAAPLYWVSWAMPLTYAYDGLDELRRHPELTAAAAGDLTVVVALTAAALALGAATLRRRTE